MFFRKRKSFNMWTAKAGQNTTKIEGYRCSGCWNHVLFKLWTTLGGWLSAVALRKHGHLSITQHNACYALFICPWQFRESADNHPPFVWMQINVSIDFNDCLIISVGNLQQNIFLLLRNVLHLLWIIMFNFFYD